MGKFSDSEKMLRTARGTNPATLDRCKALCVETEGCVAVDYDGYHCYSYSEHVPVRDLKTLNGQTYTYSTKTCSPGILSLVLS